MAVGVGARLCECFVVASKPSMPPIAPHRSRRSERTFFG